MDLGIASFIIDQYQPYKVIFFGGEPLLCIDVIEQLLQNYPKQNFQLITSLTVNVDQFIDMYFKYHLRELQVSWDGWNDNRCNKQGESISQLVYNNFHKLIQKHIPFDIKAVVAEYNVDQLVELHHKFLDLQRHRVYGQFVFAHRVDYTDKYFETLEQDLIKTFDLRYLYREHAQRLIAYLSNKQGYTCDVGKYIVVNAKRNVSYCTALMYTDMQQDHLKLQQICPHEDCVKCKYNYMCDGGCRYERYQIFHDQWLTNHLSSTCRFMEIYHNTMAKFVQDLTSTERIKLYQLIKHYRSFLNRMKGM
jgi:radical SAM protein with 4Fe4S-binding SPASM domain